MALHLYAVVRAGSPIPDQTELVAPSGGPLERIDHGSVGVLASALRADAVKVTPSNLHAHQAVAEQAAEVGVALPFRFGVVAHSSESVIKHFLAPNEDRLTTDLDRFDGLIEMRVTVRYEGDAALRDVVNSSARIRRMKQRLSRRPAAATYYDRIALGEEVAAELERLRARDEAAWSAALSRPALGERGLRTEQDGDDFVLRAAYLLHRHELPAFEIALEQMSNARPDRVRVSLTGPLAPWDFVSLHGRGLDSSGRRRSKATHAEAVGR